MLPSRSGILVEAINMVIMVPTRLLKIQSTRLVFFEFFGTIFNFYRTILNFFGTNLIFFGSKLKFFCTKLNFFDTKLNFFALN